jgi:uncharacterized protein with HEPN domain
MPLRTPESYLFDILEATRKIQRFTAGYDEERFKQDEKTVSAVERQFMIISEAAKHVDPAFSNQFPEIDFRLAKAMRNFIVHHYDRVDTGRIWQTVKENVPDIIRALEPFVADRLPQGPEEDAPTLER